MNSVWSEHVHSAPPPRCLIHCYISVIANNILLSPSWRTRRSPAIIVIPAGKQEGLMLSF